MYKGLEKKVLQKNNVFPQNINIIFNIKVQQLNNSSLLNIQIGPIQYECMYYI